MKRLFNRIFNIKFILTVTATAFFVCILKIFYLHILQLSLSLDQFDLNNLSFQTIVILFKSVLSIILGEHFILYANTSEDGKVYVGSSTEYQGDTSRSPSLAPGEPKFQFGGLVDGLAYSEVQSIRSDIHSYVVNTLRANSAVTVSEIVINTNNPSTHKVF